MDLDGSPAAGQLVLVAWPRQEILSGMRVGDHVKLLPVAKARAQSDGGFVLRVDPSVPIAETMTPDGMVNFELVATTSRGQATISFPRRFEVSDGTPGWHDVNSAASADAVDLRVTGRVGSGTVSAPNGARAPAPAIDKFCNSTFETTYPVVWGIIAEQYSGPNATSKFFYSAGATSTQGVGVSASGDFGTFSASGTSGIGSSASIDFATQPQFALWIQQTLFQYARFRVDCMNPPALWYEARPYQWVGGSTGYTAASAPAANFCTPYNPNDSPSIDQHTSITFSNGVAMSGPIGIDLSNQTGFTTTARLSFFYVNPGWLCGTNDYPFQAYRVVGQ
jgi:hypothetical protein